MPFSSAVALDQLAQSQSGHATTANQVLAALSVAALFGIRGSLSSGLTIVFYGGNYLISGTPTFLADQTITLTDATTNYIYATSAGVITKTTTIPGAWPGPLAAGATALYTLVTAGGTVASGSCWRVGVGAAGAVGAAGPQGNPGSDFALTRKRIAMSVGGGSTLTTQTGGENLTLVGTNTAVALSTATLRQSIPYLSYVGSATAGSSAQIFMPRNTMWMGNAAGRGGFTANIRFCLESTNSPANFRCFFGLNPQATLANAEPDTFLNTIGIGSKAGDANLSFIHNDGAGSATVLTLGANFPARSTDNVYEMQLSSVANSQSVSYTITDIGTGNTVSGSTSAKLPNNTTFFGWNLWVNNGSTASAASFGWMQTVTESRY